MKGSNSTGPDGISCRMMKGIGAEVAPALAVLTNTSFTAGTFPKMFNEAHVTPIIKNTGKREDNSTYRPVLNLLT